MERKTSALMKNIIDDEDLPAIRLDEVRSRIDDGLTSLDRGKGTDGEGFMRGMLSDLDSQKTKSKSANR